VEAFRFEFYQRRKLVQCQQLDSTEYAHSNSNPHAHPDTDTHADTNTNSDTNSNTDTVTPSSKRLRSQGGRHVATYIHGNRTG
jgi:hypothetical protein